MVNESKKATAAPPLGAFTGEPGFAVVGDGNWMLPDDAFVMYVVLREPIESDAKREAFLRHLPRLCRHAVAWSGPMLRIGSHLERAYADERKAATLVRKQYGKGTKPTKLTAAEKRKFSGEELDPKVLPAVEEFFADYGKQAPWARFYGALHTWLVEAHARQPIVLTLRPVTTRELTPLHAKSVERLFDLDLAAIHADPTPWVRDFLGQVVLQATAVLPLSAARAQRLAPLLDRATGRFIEIAAEEVRLALSDEAFDALPPSTALETLLTRHDRFAARGAELVPRIERSFARFWALDPDQKTVDRTAWTIRRSLPFARETPVFDVVLTELASHAKPYAAVLGPLAEEMQAYDRAASERLAKALRA